MKWAAEKRRPYKKLSTIVYAEYYELLQIYAGERRVTVSNAITEIIEKTLDKVSRA